jgi:acyl-CoA synthetase (AMP-forming)/AMP-acid ligase II
LPEEKAKRIGEKMRLFVCGSAPLPANVLKEFRQKFGHMILERYGMSETLMNLSNPYAGTRRAGSVGFPLPGISVKIVDSEMKPVSEGEIGELWCAVPMSAPDIGIVQMLTRMRSLTVGFARAIWRKNLLTDISPYVDVVQN